MAHNIKTPKNKTISSNKNFSSKIIFNANFGNKYSDEFNKKQKFIDNEVIKLMMPFTPKDTGVLYKSPYSQTHLGSGLIIQKTPYAKKQYYMKNRKHIVGKRNSYWFENMKKIYKAKILQGAEKIDS